MKNIFCCVLLVGLFTSPVGIAPCDVLVIGDSNTEIASALFPDKNYYARGGWTAEAAAYDDLLLQFLNERSGRLVFIKLGTNDIYNVAGYEKNIEKIIYRVLLSGNTPVLVQIPNNANEQPKVDRMNGLLLSIAGRHHLEFVYYESLDRDGFHINYEAQGRVNAAIDEAAQEMCGESDRR